MAEYLVTSGWEPMAPMLRYGVFASRWPHKENTLWTIVNRNAYNVNGPQLQVPLASDVRYFDLYHGIELKPKQDTSEKLTLSFSIEAHGFAAIFATRSEPDAGVRKLMSEMKQLSAKPLADYPSEWKVLRQEIVPIKGTAPAKSAPTGMVEIPDGEFDFRVQGIEIEGFNDVGVDVQYPWEDAPRR